MFAPSVLGLTILAQPNSLIKCVTGCYVHFHFLVPNFALNLLRYPFSVDPRCTRVESALSIVTWIIHMVSCSPTCRTLPEPVYLLSPHTPMIPLGFPLSCLKYSWWTWYLYISIQLLLVSYENLWLVPNHPIPPLVLRFSPHSPRSFRISSHKSSPSRVRETHWQSIHWTGLVEYAFFGQHSVVNLKQLVSHI